MDDDEFIAGLTLFNGCSVSIEEASEIFNELPAMRYAPRYNAGSITSLLPVDGIAPVSSTTAGPIVVTPYSIGGGYLGQYCNEAEALQKAGASVDAGTVEPGLVYFALGTYHESSFEDALYELGVRVDTTLYAAVYMSLEDSGQFPEEEEPDEVTYPHYLEQLKLISGSGIFRYPDKYRHACLEQELTIGETLWAFCEFEKSKFNPSDSVFPRELSGIIGGDGDWEREELAFGLIVEDKDAGIYRIWSRAALCTK